MKVLVTGATGFVGGHLVSALLARGQSVRAMGRNSMLLERLAAKGAEPCRVDLRDREMVIAACRGASVVFHVGALSSAWGRRSDFEAINVGGTEAIAEGCRRHGVERLVYVSSPSVLFNGRNQENLTDDAPYPPCFVSVYSETKARGEEAVRQAKGVSAVIVRPKAVYGPGDTTLLPQLVRAARAHRLPQIGNGKNRVDLTYIDNVIHGLICAADAPAAQAVGHTYTITDDEPVPPLWEVIRTVLTGLGISYPRRRVSPGIALAAAHLSEMKAHLTGKEPLLTRYGVLILARTQTYDISRARCDLGYAPVASRAEGLARTIAAFRENPAA